MQLGRLPARLGIELRQALVKVRVRINAITYVDCLSDHRIDGEWLITSKAFHVESDSGN